MAYALVIRNGMVVDGTGFSRYRADVAIQDGTIVEIGKIRGAAAATIDADGLFVAPGIIDLHTHYDAQPFWDKLCTSSVWPVVTTVLTGNCGLTLAPLKPEHREAMLATFCCVEDLPVKSLAAVLPWNWESFAEYMDAIDQGLGVNMMPLVGHNPLRLGAMGSAAWERAADADETAAMQRLLGTCMEAGAWGWSTTASPTHAGPSREASGLAGGGHAAPAPPARRPRTLHPLAGDRRAPGRARQEPAAGGPASRGSRRRAGDARRRRDARPRGRGAAGDGVRAADALPRRGWRARRDGEDRPCPAVAVGRGGASQHEFLHGGRVE